MLKEQLESAREQLERLKMENEILLEQADDDDRNQIDTDEVSTDQSMLQMVNKLSH